MTVRDWIAEHTRSGPARLTSLMIAALGPDADLSSERTTDVCLAAAVRALDALLAEQRFGRESALHLLAVDALTTLAYEHASEIASSGDHIAEAGARGARALGRLTLAHV